MKRNIGILGSGTKTPPEVIREGLNDIVDAANDQVLLPWVGIGQLKDDWEIVYDWVLTHEVDCLVYAASNDVHPLIADAANVRIIESDHDAKDPVLAISSNSSVLLYLWGTGDDIPEELERAVNAPSPPESVLDLTNGLVPVIVSDEESTSSDNLSYEELDIMPATFVKAYAQERTGQQFTTKTAALGAMFPDKEGVDNSAPEPPVVSSGDTPLLRVERIRNAVNDLVSAIAEELAKENESEQEG
jgi:hypothetical protein